MTQLIYVPSVSHSGSTLLDVILASQPTVFGLGEVHRLSMPVAERVISFGNRCACGQVIEQCEFWQLVFQGVKEKGLRGDVHKGIPIALSHFDAEQHKRNRFNQLLTLLATPKTAKLFCLFSHRFKLEYLAAQRSWQFFDVIAKHTKSRYLVDSSKSPGRMKMLYLVRPHNMKVIRLVRNGRGVVHSLCKKKFSFDNACQFWFKQNNAIHKTLLSMRYSDVLWVRYEQYCDDINSTVKQLASFLNLTEPLFDIKLDTLNCHQIPGNTMLHNNRQKISKDEQWKDNWDTQKEAVFERVCGKLSRKFGYDVEQKRPVK